MTYHSEDASESETLLNGNGIFENSDEECSLEMKNSPSKDILKVVNIQNTKLISLILIFAFILYHVCLRLMNTNDSCHWLLSKGHFHGLHVWQPYGCMMHNYSKIESRECFRMKSDWGLPSYIFFIGDVRVKNLYQQFVNKLDVNLFVKSRNRSEESRSHFYDSYIKVKVEFVEVEYINARYISTLRKLLELPFKKQPNLIVASSGVFPFTGCNDTRSVLKNYSLNLSYAIPILHELSSHAHIIWMLQHVQDIYNTSFVKQHFYATNKEMIALNKVAYKKIQSTGIFYWNAGKLISDGYLEASVYGNMLYPNESLDTNAQILFNLLCNKDIQHYDGYCCSIRKPVLRKQALAGSILGLLACVYLCAKMLKKTVRLNIVFKKFSFEIPILSNTLSIFSKVGLIVIYCFLCDNINFFMKENKYFTPIRFILPMVYGLAVGLFFTEKIEDTSMMSRTKLNELKGLMQYYLFLYHFIGAEEVLPLLFIAKVFLSFYLIIFGFSHFTYFWTTGDCSASRVFHLLLRYNFIAVLFCLIMNHSYQFYQFIPLITLWLIIIVIQMTIYPRVFKSTQRNSASSAYIIILFKMLVLGFILAFLYTSEVFFEKIFSSQVVRLFFKSEKNDIKAWWNIWSYSRFCVLFGMIISLIYDASQELSLHTVTFSQKSHLFAVLISVITFISYCIFIILCKSLEDFNEVNAYISFLPFISFIYIRNSFAGLRNRCSSVFVWLGKFSLQFYLIQHHMWQAANTRGVLALLPDYPTLNALIIGFICICVSHELDEITKSFTSLAAPKGLKFIIINATLFALLLIPIFIINFEQ